MWGFLDEDVCGTGFELCVLMLQFRLTSFALGAEVNALLKRLVCLLILLTGISMYLHSCYTSLPAHLHPVTPTCLTSTR